MNPSVNFLNLLPFYELNLVNSQFKKSIIYGGSWSRLNLFASLVLYKAEEYCKNMNGNYSSYENGNISLF